MSSLLPTAGPKYLQKGARVRNDGKPKGQEGMLSLDHSVTLLLHSIAKTNIIWNYG